MSMGVEGGIIAEDVGVDIDGIAFPQQIYSQSESRKLLVSVIASVVVLLILLSWNDIFTQYLLETYPGEENIFKRKKIHALAITFVGVLFLIFLLRFYQKFENGAKATYIP